MLLKISCWLFYYDIIHQLEYYFFSLIWNYILFFIYLFIISYQICMATHIIKMNWHTAFNFKKQQQNIMIDSGYKEGTFYRGHIYL